MPLNRRSRLQAKVPLKRRSPLRARGKSPSRFVDTGPDRATRDTVLERDDWRCVACGRVVLNQQFSVQHRRARGSGGSSDPRINAPSNLILLCGSATSPGGCHLWCERRNSEAEDLGYVVSLNSREDPASVPVHHALFGLVYLLDDGGWSRAPDRPGTDRLITDLKTAAAADAPAVTADETEPLGRNDS